MSFTKAVYLNKIGGRLDITLTCQTTGYIMFVYGPERCKRVLIDNPAKTGTPPGKKLVKADPGCTEYQGEHAGPEALVCNEEGCKGTRAGEYDGNLNGNLNGDFKTVDNGFTCSDFTNIDGTISGTCSLIWKPDNCQFIE
jgi:hypothetical protein